MKIWRIGKANFQTEGGEMGRKKFRGEKDRFLFRSLRLILVPIFILSYFSLSPSLSFSLSLFMMLYNFGLSLKA